MIEKDYVPLTALIENGLSLDDVRYLVENKQLRPVIRLSSRPVVAVVVSAEDGNKLALGQCRVDGLFYLSRKTSIAILAGNRVPAHYFQPVSDYPYQLRNWCIDLPRLYPGTAERLYGCWCPLQEDEIPDLMALAFHPLMKEQVYDHRQDGWISSLGLSKAALNTKYLELSLDSAHQSETIYPGWAFLTLSDLMVTKNATAQLQLQQGSDTAQSDVPPGDLPALRFDYDTPPGLASFGLCIRHRLEEWAIENLGEAPEWQDLWNDMKNKPCPNHGVEYVSDDDLFSYNRKQVNRNKFRKHFNRLNIRARR